MRQRMPRIENEKHRRFIAGLGCILCGREDTQAAHISYADLSVAKPYTAMNSKADDCFIVPLCVEHHAQQHAHGNERDWWGMSGLDPVKIALRLYSVSGDPMRAQEVMNATR